MARLALNKLNDAWSNGTNAAPNPFAAKIKSLNGAAGEFGSIFGGVGQQLEHRDEPEQRLLRLAGFLLDRAGHLLLVAAAGELIVAVEPLRAQTSHLYCRSRLEPH